jgi:SET domain-containing protein
LCFFSLQFADCLKNYDNDEYCLDQLNYANVSKFLVSSGTCWVEEEEKEEAAKEALWLTRCGRACCFFQNHSCSSNLNSWTVLDDTRITLYANSDIEAGAELTMVMISLRRTQKPRWDRLPQNMTSAPIFLFCIQDYNFRPDRPGAMFVCRCGEKECKRTLL